jgi:glycosyltransferase involved in cell wall biosynthesis
VFVKLMRMLTDRVVRQVGLRRYRLPRAHDLVVNQLAFGFYRQSFLDALAASGADILFLVGEQHFGSGVVTDVSSPIVRRTGVNVFLLGRRIGWQRRCVGHGLRARYLCIELNPRNMTSWLLLMLRGTMGRPTVAWGHAHSRRGPAPEHNRVRRLMQRWCNALIAYTEAEAEELRSALPRATVWVAPNALYSVEQMARFAVRPLDQRTDLIIIGRLVPEKKAILGVQAFAKAIPDLPDDVVMHVVGAGSQESELHEYITAAGLASRVRLHGWVSDLGRLAPILEKCCALVSPGYVGLNVIQSLGFGAPVLFARDEPHAPEINALGTANSRVFASDDVEACREAIVGFHRDRRNFDAEAIAETIRADYSTDRMVEPFLLMGGERDAVRVSKPGRVRLHRWSDRWSRYLAAARRATR